ncbi:plasmid replication protein, CyRepA1 family [Planktothrix agardhii]|uniref:DUF3854 domain-containing protein n=2 Tax=Planktothrix agardhii TaxID=1160 RepID=A0AAD1Q6C8_PLAAG|nr:plasmid replication protein, CyRepA1 family [Planktothrix agardhii]CAD5983174.1 DUF3854 domain-containing protein [Planktothrix agardhii]
MINPQHSQEFLESAIDLELAAKNFESIPKGDDKLPFDLYPNLSGKRSDLKKINNCHRSSGWICRTLDPTTGVRLADYFRFKADKGSPLQKSWDYEKKILKTSKYRSPVGVPSRLGFFELTQNIIELVRGRYSKAFTKDRIGNFLKRHESTETTITPCNFWLFVAESPLIPVGLAEGEKKAAALLSIGIVAISIPGVRMGYRRNGDGLALHPDLALFAQQGRQITFYFDSDIKPSTCKNTESAIANTGRLLLKENCNISVVSIPLLDGFKGAIDDYLYKFGSDSFDNLKPESFVNWEYGIERKYRITRTPNLILNTESMGKAIDINILPKHGLIIPDGAKGTGKTELIEKATRGDDKAVLANVHRVFLGRGLAARLNADYRSDLERITHNKQSFYLNESGENSDRLVGCSEGLIALYSTIKTQFIESLKLKVLVIDEVDQVFISLLMSPTCNKDGNRPVILSIYEEIIKATDLIILASADVSDIEINYVLAVRNKGQEPNTVNDFPVFYIKNEYVSKGYNTYFIDHTEEMIKAISMEIDCGGNIWAMFDSKAYSEEVYKTVYEDVASTLKQGEKLLLINSNNSDEPEQIEFIKILSKPNNTEEITQFLKQYRGVFVTQSLWTSLSVEVPHFTSVYAFLTCGISPDWDISQGLSRVRSLVNRYIYCVKKGQQTPGVNGYYASQIKKNLQTKTEINNRVIYSSLFSTFDPIANYNWGWNDNPNIEAFCQYAARHNRSVANLKERLEARLEFEGNTILPYEYCFADDIAELKAEMKAKRVETKTAKQERILFNTKVISDDDAKTIEQKRSKLTQDEQDKLELYHIGKFYKLDGPDGLFARLDKNPEDNEARAELEEIYRNDNGGRSREQIKRLEYLTGGKEGFDRAIADDVRSLNRQSKHGNGIFAPDLKTSTSKIFILEKIANFTQYLDPDKIQNKETLQPLADALGSISFTELSAILGIKIPKAIGEGSTNILWLFSKILEALGVKVKTKRVRVKGTDNKESQISIDPTRWEWLQKTMARRSENLTTVNLGELEVLHPTDLDWVRSPDNLLYNGAPDPKNQTTNPQHDQTPPPPLDVEKIMDRIVDQVIVEDATGRPDIVVTQSNPSTWITAKRAYISRNDIREGYYRPPNLNDVVGWMKTAIAEASPQKAQWLDNNFGHGSDCLMERAMNAFFYELAPIYDLLDAI